MVVCSAPMELSPMTSVPTENSADDLRKIEPFVPYTVGTETVDYGG